MNQNTTTGAKNEESVLAFLKSYTLKNLVAPSFNELASACGLTKNGVAKVMKRLVKRGLVRKLDHRSVYVPVI